MAQAVAMEPGQSTENSEAPVSGGRLVAADGRMLPLRHAELSARAEGGLARVVVTQRFVNPHAEPLDVTYLLPLPSDGAVSGFSFVLGEKRIVGEIDRRGAARERFEAALVEGRTAALLEQDRTSSFTQELGNVPPGVEIVAEVIVDQPLRWLEEGAWEWRFPTVVGPRYGVPDAKMTTVDVSPRGVGARASLALTICDRFAKSADVESVSHGVDVVEENDALAVRFGGDAGVRLDRDVVVRWRSAQATINTSLAVARSARPALSSAHGLLTVVPPERSANTAAVARDLIVLIDTSGSMSGRPLEQAKRVVLALLDTLTERDTVELIEFGSRPRRFQKDPVVGSSDGRTAASKWVRALSPSGATEMGQAVIEALSPLRDEGQRQVVLLTDGWIGFERDVIREVLDRLPRRSRLHVVGVGSAPNRTLTQGASRAGRGVELVVGLDEDAERAAARLVARTDAPVVTDLEIGGDAVLATAPSRLPDLFAASPVSIALELAPEGGSLVVRGRGADGPFQRTLDVASRRPGEGNQAFVSLFGRERADDLEMEISAGGDVQTLESAIEQTGLDFGISTRLTSWIAVTEARTVDGDARHERMPHELPHGVSIEGLGLRPVAGYFTGQRMQTQAGVASLGRLEELAALPPQAPAGGGADRVGKARLASAYIPEPMEKRTERRRGILGALILLVVLALAGLGVWLIGDWGESRPAPAPTSDAPSAVEAEPGD